MMACPVKYRALGHFHEYYAETKRSEKLTIVIGGNHESSGYLWETYVCSLLFRSFHTVHPAFDSSANSDTCTIGDISYHGGWLAPNIYFLGFAGSVLVDGWLRIAGASGIWKSGDWKKGDASTLPALSWPVASSDSRVLFFFFFF